jgi:hypothetical protein
MNSVQYTGKGEKVRAWKICQKCIDIKSAQSLTAYRDYYMGNSGVIVIKI